MRKRGKGASIGIPQLPSHTALHISVNDPVRWEVRDGEAVLKADVGPVAAAAAAPAAARAVAVASAPVVAASPAAAAPVPAHNPTSPPIGLPHASPSVRKFARELGVPLDEVTVCSRTVSAPLYLPMPYLA